MSNTDEEDRPLRLENNEEYGDYEEDEDEGYYRSENDEEYGDEEEDVEEEDYEDDEYGDEEEVEEEDENGGLEEDEEGLLQLFQPTEAQAYSVFNQICEKCPPEITSIILDYAGYWPVKRWLNNNTRVDGYWCGNGQDGKSQIVHVSTRADNEVDDPLPKRITKIRVRAIAHDQGWAGDRHSWTWGEIVFHYKDGKVTAHDFYRNRTAYDRKQVHEMVFDVGTMECLGSVSKIDVVHFAQFPGWCNYVYSSLIEVSYAVDFQLGD
jgi:hypothetical protein